MKIKLVLRKMYKTLSRNIQICQNLLHLDKLIYKITNRVICFRLQEKCQWNLHLD